MEKAIERGGPYIIATIFTVAWYFLGADLTGSQGYDGALEASISMCSILLGFVVAIFPVVLSLRSKGNYIDRVIVQGGKLLKSYNVEAVMSGFALIIIVIFNFFRFDTRESIKSLLFFSGYFALFFLSVVVSDLCIFGFILFLQTRKTIILFHLKEKLKDDIKRNINVKMSKR